MNSTNKQIELAENKARQIQAELRSYITTIDKALEAANSAKTTDTWGLLLGDPVVDLFSSFKNASAGEELENVKRAAKALQQSIKNYGALIEDARIEEIKAGISVGTGLALVAAFGDASFADILAICELSKAINELNQAREAAVRMRETIEAHLNTINKAKRTGT